MAGPVRRNGGVFYFRRELPKDLWDAKDRLQAIGLKVGSKEIWKSLRTVDSKVAAQRYLTVAAELEAEWGVWREALVSGPTVLSERNITALAGEHAKAFLAKHQDDPDAIPDVRERQPPSLSVRFFAEVSSLSKADQDRLGRAASRLMSSVQAGASLGIALAEWSDDHVLYPLLRRLIAEPLGETLESEHGPGSDRSLVEKGEAIAPLSRVALLLEEARLNAAARRSLQHMADTRDFAEPDWLKTVPDYKPSPQATKAKGKRPDAAASLEALLDHKATTQSMKALTVSRYRSSLADFTRFAKHDDPRRVTREEVRRWRDALQARGLTPKTINDDYLAGLKSVLRHGVKEFDLPTNPADAIRDERQPPAPTRSKDYSEEEAKAILAATFKGSTKAVSIPHQRALFWVPWICAYTGLRVGELTQFRGRNLHIEGDIPVMVITPEDGSTKSGKAWATVIHPHLVKLGLLEMLRAIGDGPAFYVPYDTDLTKLKRHRAKDAADRIATWIKEEVGIKQPPGDRPNHAWRHLFTTLSREHAMDKEARDYMMGSRSQTDAREGYGEWPPGALKREIDKLPAFSVQETDWRPPLAKVAPEPIRGAPIRKRRLTPRKPKV